MLDFSEESSLGRSVLIQDVSDVHDVCVVEILRFAVLAGSLTQNRT